MTWLIVLLFFAWATYDELKKNKQRKALLKELEHERKKEAYFRQKAELLKTTAVNTSDEAEQLEPAQPEDPHLKYKPEYQATWATYTKIDKSLVKNAKAWSDDFVLSLEWKRYEEVCCELLKAKGHNAKTTGVGVDGGIDIVVRNDNDVIVSVAQCKAFGKKPIGVALIRELFGVMASEKAENGLFFTTSTFSNDAVEFAKNKPIKLIDLKTFVRTVNALDDDSRIRLYEFATQGDFTTPSCARCDVKMVKRVSSKNNSEFWICPNFPRCRSTINVRA